MSVQYKDYYQSLGVPRTATADELKKAFRKLAREFHPDVAKDKKRAEEKFKEINEAYEVLSDPEKRKKYDELGPNWKSGGDFGGAGAPGGSPFGGRRTYSQPRQGGPEFEFEGAGFSDFFEQMFGSRHGQPRGGFAQPGGESERGQDIEGDIMVTLEEVMHGSVREVNVRYRVGRSIKTETHQVKVPAGVTEGAKLRLAGKGEAGASGGSSGDLYLRVRLAKHPDFDVDGHNLVHEVDLTPWEAVLGAEISVPTLTGKVKIKIAAGTQSGQKLRVRSRGLKQLDGSTGDLLVVTQVVFPAKITDNEKKLWTQLAQESKFNPRD
jgi:curved DNA-binding protein